MFVPRFVIELLSALGRGYVVVSSLFVIAFIV